jgi:hypothetical protein
MRSILLLALLLAILSATNGDQNPKVWDALAKLRGKELSIQQIDDLLHNALPGTDFPIFSAIPEDIKVKCASFNQPGFYADVDAGRCQVFHRCDVNGDLTSYLCPNMTVSNSLSSLLSQSPMLTFLSNFFPHLLSALQPNHSSL